MIRLVKPLIQMLIWLLLQLLFGMMGGIMILRMLGLALLVLVQIMML